MIKTITIDPTSTPVVVTAESVDGKLTLSPNGLVATVGVSTLNISKTEGTPIDQPNIPPTVSAGADQTIKLPTSVVVLTGVASDVDGTIVDYSWDKVSGGSAVIVSPRSATTSVTNLVTGAYVFQLTATDNKGISKSDTVSITVQAADVVTPPTDGYVQTFFSGFDKRADITTNNGQYGRGVISTTKFVTGPGSFYSIPAEASNGMRSEVQYETAATNPIEGAMEYDVFYEVIIPSNCHSFQWHPYTSGGSASPGLWHVGSKFAVVRWKNGGLYQQTKAADGGPLMTIPKGKWLKMRWEFKFANSFAYCRLYIDGVLYYDQKPASDSWLGDGSGQYPKIGFNGFSADSPNSRIYYDNFKVYKKA